MISSDELVRRNAAFAATGAFAGLAALPDSWVQGSSGTRYQLAASLPRLTWHHLTDAA
jgi:hypothetical protein